MVESVRFIVDILLLVGTLVLLLWAVVMIYGVVKVEMIEKRVKNIEANINKRNKI